MKALKPEDFSLSPAELESLVTGAQTFLAPAPDPADDERLVEPLTPADDI